MGKLPEDLKLALESLSLIEEKFVRPLSRLEQVLRVCVEIHLRIDAANGQLEKLQGDIAQAQQAKANLEKIQAACTEKHQEHHKISKEIELDTRRLQEIRDRIRRAQTMEP